MNVTMKMWIDAYRRKPKLSVIKPVVSDPLSEMSPGRRVIYDAYMSGITNTKDLTEYTKMSNSFITTSLRQFAERKLITRKETHVSPVRKEKKTLLLSLIDNGLVDIPLLAVKVDRSVEVIRKYLLELKSEKKVIYIPGKVNVPYTLMAKCA